MEERSYAIEMQTPLGIKHGTIKVMIEQNEIRGFLDVMNHSEPFYGNINTEGYCEFTGRIITLMRTIEYQASGKIDADRISLAICGERNVFQVTGVVCSCESEKQRG